MTKAEKYAATKQVEAWISKGFSRATIRIMIEEKFGIKSYGAQNKMIARAVAELDKGLDPQSMKAIMTNRLDHIAEKAFSEGKYNDSIRALSECSKLMGLNDTPRVEIKDDDKTYTVTFGG